MSKNEKQFKSGGVSVCLCVRRQNFFRHKEGQWPWRARVAASGTHLQNRGTWSACRSVDGTFSQKEEEDNKNNDQRQNTVFISEAVKSTSPPPSSSTTTTTIVSASGAHVCMCVRIPGNVLDQTQTAQQPMQKPKQRRLHIEKHKTHKKQTVPR